jgi:hypothetical protein
MSCTITQNLKIVPGTKKDYESLSHYHYREHHLGPYAAIYAIKGEFSSVEKLQTDGVIVYAMPTTGCQMRNAVFGFLSGLDKNMRLALINKNIRTISRVIIEPRFRTLGLAVRLVKETMPLLNVPVIEALAVMGQVNPFFEKAGMTRIDAPPSARVCRLIEAFGAIGITESGLIDPQLVQQKLDSMLDTRCSMPDFIEEEISRFLQCYGRRRLMKPGLERTKFVLSKLTDRPVYYFWKNPKLELRI